jgi:NADPH:quinone reductase-like Zn-dependent oxidoreductase
VNIIESKHNGSLPTDVSSSGAGPLSPPKQPELNVIRAKETIMSRTTKFAEAEGPEVLEFSETQVPAPGPHEVRIKVTAIGINRAESMWANDQYIEPVKFLAGLGYDAAGIVDAVGKDVTDFAAGDTVSTISAFSQNQYFTYGEVILVPDYAVVKHPKWLSFIEAASIWMMFIAACGALIADAKSSPFKKGPVSAAPSGVSHAHR